MEPRNSILSMQADDTETVTAQSPERGHPEAAGVEASVTTPVEGETETAGRAENKGPASFQMLLAMWRLNYPMYEGTAPETKVRKRRAANKVAKASRKANRK